MISIRRYMQESGEASASEDSEGSVVLSRLCTRILDDIGAYVFTGEFSRFRPQLEEAKKVVGAPLPEIDAAHVGSSVREVLAGYNRVAQESLQSTALEMQQMMGVLGHALTVISGDSDRSIGRLQRIQETIQRTATLQDINVLRSSLRDIVQLIGEESKKERHAGMREREGLESQVVRFRARVASHPNRRLPGRVEAIRALSDSVASVPAGNTVWVLAFVFDQLKAIVRRYGAEATDDLFLQVLRERLQPLAPAYTAFRWSPNALVGVVQFQSGTETVQADMARLNQAPLVYRVSLGGRTAVLKVGLSHLSLEASGPRFSSIERLVEGVDGFTGYAGAV